MGSGVIATSARDVRPGNSMAVCIHDEHIRIVAGPGDRGQSGMHVSSCVLRTQTMAMNLASLVAMRIMAAAPRLR